MFAAIGGGCGGRSDGGLEAIGDGGAARGGAAGSGGAPHSGGASGAGGSGGASGSGVGGAPGTGGSSGGPPLNPCLLDNGGCGPAKFVSCIPGPKPTCADIEECAINNGGCGDPARVTCVERYAASPACIDVKECAFNNGGCGDPRYISCVERELLPPLCNDILECNTNNGNCGSVLYMKCIEQRAAPPRCEDVLECQTNNGGCGNPAVRQCIEKVGGPPTCEDIGGCALCSKFGICAPQTNGFSCVCRPGYMGTGAVCNASIDMQPPTGTRTEGTALATAYYTVKGYVVTVSEDVTVKALSWWVYLPAGGYVSARIYDATTKGLLASGTDDKGTDEERWYSSTIPYTLRAGSSYAIVMFNPTALKSPMDYIGSSYPPSPFALSPFFSRVESVSTNLETSPADIYPNVQNAWHPFMQLSIGD